MDDNIFDGMNLESNNEDFPELKANQVWAAKLTLVTVKFPSPQHAEIFFKMITMMIGELCDKLGMEIVQSTTAIGIAEKRGGSPFEGLDFNKFKN